MAPEGWFHGTARNCSLLVIIILAGCGGGSDNATPQSTTTTPPPSTAQEPTKPPPITQPPNQAPPTTQPPGSQPPPGSGSSGAFTQGTGFNSDVRTIVMAQDGTHDLYVGGDFTTYNGITANHLVRLRPDGTIAHTFGQGFDEVVLALALAADGSNAVYAGGAFSQFNGQPVRPIVRLTQTGIRDTGFQAASILDFTPIALAIPEDGSGDVYAGGNINRGIPNSPADVRIGRVVRLNRDGGPDAAFPIDLEIPGPADDIAEVVTGLSHVPGTGKVYVGGDVGLVSNGQSFGGPLRLNPNGTVDSTFMTGTGTPQIGQTNGTEVIALAGNGSRDLYAGGRIGSYNGTSVTLGAIRILETGALDTSFVPADPMIVFAIAPAEDGTGDVLIFGLGTRTEDRPSRLIRLNRNGGVISTFHEPTLGSGPLSGGLILTIVPVRDGTSDLYIGGEFTTYNGVPVNHIARIHADGTLASVVN